MFIKESEVKWASTGYIPSSQICSGTREVQNLLTKLKYSDELVTKVSCVKYSKDEISVSWYKLQPMKH